MKITPLSTHRVEPAESLEALLRLYVPPLQEGDILAVTSKVVSLCENRVIPIGSEISKKALIEQEADTYLDIESSPYNILLTTKHHLLIPSAGIDESNGPGVYILYPKDPFRSAAEIWDYLRERDQIKTLGVLITDSHTTPLRRGVTGIALAWCGFHPLKNYIGSPDLFGRPLKVTQVNLVDGLASAAVLMMGEGSERTPFALLRDMPSLVFEETPPTREDIQKIVIPLEEDLYRSFLENGPWKTSK